MRLWMHLGVARFRGADAAAAVRLSGYLRKVGSATNCRNACTKSGARRPRLELEDSGRNRLSGRHLIFEQIRFSVSRHSR